MRKKLRLLLAIAVSLLTLGRVSAQEDWQEKILADLVDQNEGMLSVINTFGYPFLAQTEQELETRKEMMARLLEESEYEDPAIMLDAYYDLSNVQEAINSGELVEITGMTIFDRPLYVHQTISAKVQAFVDGMNEAGVGAEFWVTSSVRPILQNLLLYALGYPVAREDGLVPSAHGYSFSLAVNNSTGSNAYRNQQSTGFFQEGCIDAARLIEDAPRGEEPIPTVAWLVETGCLIDRDYIAAYNYLVEQQKLGVIQLVDVTFAYSGFITATGKYQLDIHNIKPVLSVIFMPDEEVAS